MIKHNFSESEIFNTNIHKEDENDNFLLNLIFEPFPLHNEKKIEINPNSLDINKKIEVKENINIEELEVPQKGLKYKSNNNIFLIKKEKDEQNMSNKINDLSSIMKSSNKTDQKVEKKKIIKFVEKKEIGEQNRKLYRKDYYYKHFKALFAKYLKNKINNLKNKCFPNFIFYNFCTPNYSFTGNAKELDNYNFLYFSIKDILVYKENKNNCKIRNKGSNQNNNKILIEYILNNKNKNKDSKAYQELTTILNNKFELALKNFYEDKKEFKIVSQDEDCLFYDKYFEKETGISLLEKNGFLKAIQKNIKQY